MYFGPHYFPYLEHSANVLSLSIYTFEVNLATCTTAYNGISSCIIVINILRQFFHHYRTWTFGFLIKIVCQLACNGHHELEVAKAQDIEGLIMYFLLDDLCYFNI